MADCYQWQQGNLVLYCHIQSNASKDEFSGEFNQRIKIRIKAQAIEGKANKQIIAFLSKSFGVSKSQIIIEKGVNNKQKTILIENPITIPKALETIINKTGI